MEFKPSWELTPLIEVSSSAVYAVFLIEEFGSRHNNHQLVKMMLTVVQKRKKMTETATNTTSPTRGWRKKEKEKRGKRN